ncbi:MAG: cytochrome c [Candidatus Thiodiazotropha sp.]
MKKTTNLLSITLLALTLSGCSGSNDFKPAAGMDGLDIYANACTSCHGDGGQGKFGFLLKLAGTDESPKEITEKIINGGKLMPAFPNINQQQAEQVADYLKKQ